MAGLVPAIHVCLSCDIKKDVDARHKAGHDDRYIEIDIQQKGGTGFPCPALVLILARDRPQCRLPGSTFTPGPMVEETATRWM